MKLIKALIVILLMVLIIILAIQNIEPITDQHIVLRLNLVKAQWHTDPIPLGAVIVVSFLTGVFLMWLWYLRNDFQNKKRIRALKKQVKGHRSEASSYLSEPSYEPPDHAGEEDTQSLS